MSKQLETLKTRYHELSRSFLTALQNDRSSEELEAIRQEIKDVVARMKILNSSQPSPEDSPNDI